MQTSSWPRAAAFLGRPPLGLTLLLCASILVARRPDLLQSPQFWAEDGPVFFAQSRTLGAAALLQPSAGYLHTALRMIAWLAAQVDVTLAPAFFVAAAGMLTLYVAARTQSRRFPFRHSIAYPLALVMVPDAYEVLLNLTNLQWVLAAGLLLILISRDALTPAQRGHDVAALIVLGLTGPFIIAFLPLFAWRAWRRATHFSAMLAVVAGACAAVQTIVILRNPIAATVAPMAVEMLLGIPGLRVGSSLLAGGRVGADAGFALASGLGVLTLAAIGFLAVRRGTARIERVWLGFAFAGVLAMTLFRCRYLWPALYHGQGSRYIFPLQLIALWLIIPAASAARPWIAQAARWALVVIALVNLPRLREPAFPDLRWTEYAARIRNGEHVTVKINPDQWAFTLPGRPVAAALPVPAGAFVNVSARCTVSPGQPAIVGFILQPGAARRLLLRAVGPSLAQFGVAHPLSRPTLKLVERTGNAVALAVRGEACGALSLAFATERCGAFALAAGAGDFAGIAEVAPGSYSVIVDGGANSGGEVLIEVYEVPAV
ncbi:MAG TPA: hypothetical protein VM029_17335 [Opitutaceae bacterium]|nr:hypothetical protein [Opitutaceae bacterium]